MKRVAGRLGLGLALATCILAGYGAWLQLSSPLLPGPLAPYSVMLLQELRGSMRPFSQGPSTLLAFALWGLGLQSLDAFRLLAPSLFALVALSSLAASYALTKSAWSSLAAALASSLLPPLYGPLLLGDYGLLFVLAITTLLLALSLFSFLGRSRASFAASLVLSALLGWEMPGIALLLAPYFLAWALLLLMRKSAEELNYALALLLSSVGSSLLFYPLRPQPLLASLRELSLAPFVASQIAALLLSLLFCLGGLLGLYYTRRQALAPLALWPLLGLLLSPLSPSYLLIALPGALALGSCSVPLLKGLASPIRRKEEAVVELSLERVAYALTLVGLLLSSLSSLPALLDGARLSSYMGPGELAALHDASVKLTGFVADRGALLAPAKLSAWLGALTGLNVLLPSNASQAWELDAVTSTAFRIQTAYLMVDEWQPFSSRRSPFIYHYDGAIFAPLLHIDDGTNWMRAVAQGLPWPEDLHGMKLLSYSWREDALGIALTLELWKKGFNATKEIFVSKKGPSLTISYFIRPNAGVQLMDMALPLYIEGRQSIGARQEGDALVLSMPPAEIRVEYPGSSTPPKLLTGGVQDYVLANFTQVEGHISATVNITLLNARAAPVEPRHTSFFDVLSRQKPEYLLTYGAPEDLFFIEAPAQALEVKDSFSRILVNHMGSSYVEVPAQGEVLGEATNSSGLFISYRTAGLLIDKALLRKGDAVYISYSIRPWKQNTTLLSFTFSAWLSYARTAFSHMCSQELRGCDAGLDVGNVSVTAERGQLLAASFGPDPQLGQQRFQLQFSLRPQGDIITIKIAFPGLRLQLSYQPTTRPIMQGSDSLTISTYVGLLRPLYQDGLIRLYRVLPP